MTHKAGPQTPDISDNDLLARMKATDDRAAYNLLVERYIGKLWRLCVNVLASENEAEDVVQEVLLTVWQNRYDWSAEGAKFSTWAYRVTLNRCIDIKRRRQPAVDTAAIENSLASDAIPAADQALSDREEHRKVREMLNNLPESQKTALVLFYFEELNVREISVRLATTEDSVRSLLKRGRKNLKDLMDDGVAPDLGGIQGPA